MSVRATSYVKSYLQPQSPITLVSKEDSHTALELFGISIWVYIDLKLWLADFEYSGMDFPPIVESLDLLVEAVDEDVIP